MQSTSGDDWVVLQAFVLCSLAFVVIVPFNLVALHWGARFYRRRQPVGGLDARSFHHTIIFVVTVMLVLFAVHLMTNFAWGLFIYMFEVLPNYRDSVFFSLENYTSLGLTRVQVNEYWRMLAPMISLSGVFCLGWTTAVLVALFGRLYAVNSDD